MRWIAGIAVVLAAGCGHAGSAPEVECPAIGTRVGIGLTIPDPTGISRATLDACWGDQCVTRPVVLGPETTAKETTCTNGVCGASMVPTGGPQGFADIPSLPAEPVK